MTDQELEMLWRVIQMLKSEQEALRVDFIQANFLDGNREKANQIGKKLEKIGATLGDISDAEKRKDMKAALSAAEERFNS
jgi:hypothetical protein